MTTSQSRDAIVAMLELVEQRYAGQVYSVPDALIMMLTTSDSPWSEAHGDSRLELLEWLAEQVSVDEAQLLLVYLQRDGKPVADLALRLEIFE